MSQDQINALLDGQKQLREAIDDMRLQNYEEHKDLVQRIVKLESSVAFIKRACWTVGAGGLIILIKQFLILSGG